MQSDHGREQHAGDQRGAKAEAEDERDQPEQDGDARAALRRRPGVRRETVAARVWHESHECRKRGARAGMRGDQRQCGKPRFGETRQARPHAA